MIPSRTRIFNTLVPLPSKVGISIIAMAISGCETIPSAPSSAGFNPSSSAALMHERDLRFVDAPPFDSKLSRSLRSSETAVEISFYDEVSPSQLPSRLQKWLGSVERNGGQILVEPPPNEPVPRSPAMLISLVGSLFNAIKVAREAMSEKLFDSTQDRDAILMLKRNNKGDVIVEKIVFRKR
jgi:hypothetical protein